MAAAEQHAPEPARRGLPVRRDGDDVLHLEMIEQEAIGGAFLPRREEQALEPGAIEPPRAFTAAVDARQENHLAVLGEQLGHVVGAAADLDRDARVGLNLLEQVCMVVPAGGHITHDAIEKVAGHKVYTYDKKGDAHYDTVSAFIKSMRGSDPDAALHYMARMIDAGEQPSFIARRLVICAAEDVGLADPQALVIANAAAQAVQFVGWPEGRIILSEAVIYVACAPKSNSAYMAIDAALADVRHKDCGVVPDYLRDSHYSGAAALGHGLTYQDPHDFDGGWVAQQYLPDALKGASYYRERPYGQEGSMAAAWHKRRGGK